MRVFFLLTGSVVSKFVDSLRQNQKPQMFSIVDCLVHGKRCSVVVEGRHHLGFLKKLRKMNNIRVRKLFMIMLVT